MKAQQGFTEDDLDKSYKSGISLGWQNASGRLMEEAQTAFSVDNDELARTLRKLANDFTAEANK